MKLYILVHTVNGSVKSIQHFKKDSDLEVKLSGLLYEEDIAELFHCGSFNYVTTEGKKCIYTLLKTNLED